MLTGVLGVVAITAMLALVLWVVFYGSAAGIFVRRHLPPPTEPAGPPIEQIAADLTRLREATLSSPPGTSHVRRVATLAAYDDALARACPALGLPDTLSELPLGTDREAERLRVEALLEDAGLRFTRPR
ncbi:hypothetical protein [Nocardioides sp. B-3]|uniref:hypothetical protein n=1 Tax=Nocardioides sp. B-3 TaxID=2895565 RepID=UPI002152475F|nr:hypothetical protein [Nocardioides sp. B-3]UUZ57831.1 hypothetical protein LP418_15670 [Nocardioides sp. B-3]